jgi:lipooligosaccharide transport system ATP-binding protein
VTILLTTHYMEEASQLCDRVVLMEKGRILLEGPPAALIEQEVGHEVLEVWNPAPGVDAFLDEVGWPHETYEERIHAYLPAGVDGGRLLGERFPHQEHALRRASLEDVFLRKAGRALKE